MSSTQEQWGHHLPKSKIMDCIDKQLRGRKTMSKNDIYAVEDQIANAFSRLQNTSRSRIEQSNYSASPKSRNQHGLVTKTNTADLVNGIKHLSNCSLKNIDQSVEQLDLTPRKNAGGDYANAVPKTIRQSPSKPFKISQASFS